MAKKNLIGLAKSGGNKTTPLKKTVEKKVEKPKTPAEERDIKAKARVEELLQDVQLSPEKKEDLLELEEEQTPKGAEWLEEQVTLLSEENDLLRSELALAKADYAKIFEENQRIRNGAGIASNDSALQAKVIELFNELQDNHIKLGTDPNSRIGNFRIYCPGFLNRMINFFPFLASVRKY